MGMVPFVVECGIPPKVLRRDLHLLGNHIPLRSKQMHPRIRIVIAQPLCILPAEGDDVCPDVAGMVVHFFLHLREHNGNTFIGEETIGASLFYTGTF